MTTSIILISEASVSLAQTIKTELSEIDESAAITIYHKGELDGCTNIASAADATRELFTTSDALIFIGAMGICVRSIAPCISDKHEDPAVVCVDSTGKFVVSVLSGHIGGANKLATTLATITGGEAVVTTQSDNTGLWALDTIAQEYGWTVAMAGGKRLAAQRMNNVITLFVNKHKTALVLETEDDGTRYMEQTKPEHVKIFHSYNDYSLYTRREMSKPNTNGNPFELLIIVSPKKYTTSAIPCLQFYPKCLHLGVGCQLMAPVEIAPQLINEIGAAGYASESIATIGSIELKKDEPLLAELCKLMPHAELKIYTADELNKVKIPNPSEKVFEVTGCYGVAEASAKCPNKHSTLVIEKQKGSMNVNGKISHYTYALACDEGIQRQGHIEIVGAGPGDPDLVSVRGRKFLEEADLILYAGSLVPRELTSCAKPGATVRSSANMDLEEQFELMKKFYDKGGLVVRLHTGDPCIYGAIQEQMNFFDQYEMDYHITPGISSFLAAAAELRSQFTIPEKVQSIILTRGEGRTPMPEKEKLHLLAQSQSTMCIFLSASIAQQVQDELLAGGYPPETPVACCYKLTWKDQKIFRGKLQDLASIMKKNKLTLTTMIVVGEAIDNREGLSKLYDGNFTHMFRKGKKK
ncbi:MAG: precorrin-4 C(11)-methyltransferase [Bacteroidaceae bacterium]|nr:precorrin-4 C(11)-methyltransferase [Bacteroidaceae bacterium]